MPNSSAPRASSENLDSNSLIVIICSALAGYNAVELLLLIFTTFKSYKGLYFWSLLIAGGGILPYAIGLCVFYFDSSSWLLGHILNNIGWMAMVTGQSVVLYSRLGLVLGKGYDRILQAVKWMIIVDGIVFHGTTTVVVFGAKYAANGSTWSAAYRYVEKIQMTGFCLQEFIISGLYVWKTLDILRTAKHKHAHRIMLQLFIINAIIIILDIALLALEYRDLFIPEVSLKELAYSVKLKLEFAILSKLVGISKNGGQRCSVLESSAGDLLDEDMRTLPTSTISNVSPTQRVGTSPQWRCVDDFTTPEKHGEKNDTTCLHSEFESALEMQSANLMYAEAVRVTSR